MNGDGHNSIIYNSQDKETPQMSIDRWMDEDVIYIYTHTHTHTRIGMNLGKLQEMVRGREAWHSAVHVVTKS